MINFIDDKSTDGWTMSNNNNTVILVVHRYMATNSKIIIAIAESTRKSTGSRSTIPKPYSYYKRVDSTKVQ